PEELNKILLDSAEELCRKSGIRGLHFLFTDPVWAASLPDSPAEQSYSGWKHCGFTWENTFANFEDYLTGFNKNQRKNIRKEYRRHEEQGIELFITEGKDADKLYYNLIFDLYSRTNDKFLPWDARWVNKDFFGLIEQHFRHRTVFSEARRNTVESPPDILALAMMFRKGDCLWGRYWGTQEDIKDLHFAACYYAPMEYCIGQGIRFFDPGLGSPHKIRRGFRADFSRSYHTFFDPVLQNLFKINIDAVNQYEEDAIAELNVGLPYKKGT
ncbi:MAG: GNAT family N-acetyltransferase, partial [Treponema sp.]|nr:GNAT family N-acetyltransferase [Treponema sp.]